MFRIGESRTHGLGWFAVCDIPADTPLLDEEVCIRMPLDLSKEDLGGEDYLEGIVSKLPEDERKSIVELHGDDLLDKLWMNGNPMIDFDKDPLGIGPRRELGIYLKCARLNHSCTPNACRASDKNSMSVVSQKNILAGEEITLSYLDDNLAVAAGREMQMRSKIRVGKTWEGCRCALCTGPTDLKEASDGRRRLLFAYREKLLQGLLTRAAMATEFLPMMREEGLPMTLMGTNATMKMMEVLHGIDMRSLSQDDMHRISFPKGAKVVLHKLRAKPELNGRTGSVVYPLNERTGRMAFL